MRPISWILTLSLLAICAFSAGYFIFMLFFISPVLAIMAALVATVVFTILLVAFIDTGSEEERHYEEYSDREN